MFDCVAALNRFLTWFDAIAKTKIPRHLFVYKFEWLVIEARHTHTIYCVVDIGSPKRENREGACEIVDDEKKGRGVGRLG